MLGDAKAEAAERSAKLESELRAELRKKLAALPQEPPTSNLSAATTLLEKRREMYEVQEALESQKQEYKRFEEIMKRREEELEARDLKLQDHLLKFNKHLQEQEHKRIKSEKKEQEERRARELKELDLAQAKRLQVQLEAMKVRLQQKLDRERVYQRFLERAVEATEYFHDVHTIQQRYNALISTRDEITAEQAARDAQEQELKMLIKRCEQDTESQLLHLNRRIAELREHAERFGLDAKAIQRQAEERLAVTRDKRAQSAQVLAAIHNLYQRALRCARTSHQGYAAPLDVRRPDDVRRMLQLVADYISDARYALETLRKPASRAQTASGSPQ